MFLKIVKNSNLYFIIDETTIQATKKKTLALFLKYLIKYQCFYSLIYLNLLFDLCNLSLSFKISNWKIQNRKRLKLIIY